MDRVLHSQQRGGGRIWVISPLLSSAGLEFIQTSYRNRQSGDSPLKPRRAKESAVPAVLETRFLPSRENYNFQGLEEKSDTPCFLRAP